MKNPLKHYFNINNDDINVSVSFDNGATLKDISNTVDGSYLIDAFNQGIQFARKVKVLNAEYSMCNKSELIEKINNGWIIYQCIVSPLNNDLQYLLYKNK